MHCCLGGLDIDVGFLLTPYLNDSRLKDGCSPLCFGSEQSQAAEGSSVEVKLAMACIGQVTAKERSNI